MPAGDARIGDDDADDRRRAIVRGVSLSDENVAASLAPAGLIFVGRVEGPVRLPVDKPPANCLPSDGRFDADRVDLNDPGLAAKLNAQWWLMASQYGLLTFEREFLLLVDGEWVRVRLAAEWDLVGGESPALASNFAGLFTRRYIPEFRMLSLDGKMMLDTTVWGNGSISTIVIRPDRMIR